MLIASLICFSAGKLFEVKNRSAFSRSHPARFLWSGGRFIYAYPISNASSLLNLHGFVLADFSDCPFGFSKRRVNSLREARKEERWTTVLLVDNLLGLAFQSMQESLLEYMFVLLNEVLLLRILGRIMVNGDNNLFLVLYFHFSSLTIGITRSRELKSNKQDKAKTKTKASGYHTRVIKYTYPLVHPKVKDCLLLVSLRLAKASLVNHIQRL